jgi:predicted amidohydrolase YtcJ
MDALHVAGELGSRLRIYLWAPGTVSLDEACAHASWTDFTSSEDLIKIHGVKMFSDGGYSAASAAVKQPYVHDGHSHYGEVALSSDQIGEALAKTAAAGLQLAIHANGDRAQEEVCEAIIAAGGPPAGVPAPRVEHAGNFLPDPTQTALWRQAGIIPVPQPVFLYTFGDFFPTYLGEYGTRGRFPFRRLLDEGWAITGSSDVWIGAEDRATNPFFSIWNCLRRESFFGEILDASERITLTEALRMHTINGAHTLGEGDRYGSLEVGKKADVIVLDRDPFACTEDELMDVRVDEVYLGGRLVHERRERRASTSHEHL